MHSRFRRPPENTFAVEDRNYPERRGAAVYPADDEGYYDNMKNNTLVKAMGAAKGK